MIRLVLALLMVATFGVAGQLDDVRLLASALSSPP